MNFKERTFLTNKLKDLLINNPLKNKYEILELLKADGFYSYTTSHINSVLYGSKIIFKKGNQTLPVWQASGTHLQNLKSQQIEAEVGLNLSGYKGHKPRAWQTEALESWISSGRRGVVEAVTGTGKTAVGIMAASDALTRGLRVMVLVPGIDLLSQWYKKLSSDLKGYKIGRFCTGYNDDLLTHKIIIATVQSAYRYKVLPEKYHGLIIADEVHRYGSEVYSLALEEAFEERLGLTATYDRNDNGIDKILSPYFSVTDNYKAIGGEVILGCGYARGLNDDILAPFRVGLLGIDFEPDEQENYDCLDDSARKLRRRLISDFNCPAEPFGEFMAYVNKLSEGGQGDNVATITARGYLSSFSKKRKLLAESSSKEKVLDLLKYLLMLANRSLVFTETKKSAKYTAIQLCLFGIKAMDFSSDLNKQERKIRMLAFEKGDVKVLCSPKVLDEGIDMPEADLGIILAASKTKRQMIQRMGRIIRPKKDGRPATFIIIYFRNTSEDPEFGAHEDFLDEMFDHAEEVYNFGDNPGNMDILNWYIKGLTDHIQE